MSELTAGFQSLPPEYQRVILLAQDQHQISVAPLQTLVGGWSGAMVYLVSVTHLTDRRVEHLILKLDRKSAKARSDETSRHVTAQGKSPADFTRDHFATLAFERVEADGAIAIFYSIAGQSLQSFRPLSNYGQQDQLETIFSATNQYLLAEWNANPTFVTLHPQELLEKWLGFRLEAGAPIENFIRQTCRAEPDRPGFLIQSSVYPNPLWYARHRESWGDRRPIDAMLGLQHGDLNTNNILVKFSPDGKELTGYYLIDFALFKEEMPLLYDLRYLEMSYLTLAMSQVSFAKTVDLILHATEATALDSRRAPIEMAGVSAILTSARVTFDRWVTEHHPSLHDDLWGQYWLAGVAAGLAYCHKAGQAEDQRLAGLIYAAANLRRYAVSFSIPLPTDVELLYDMNQAQSNKPARVSNPGRPTQSLPSGTVTFLFTDIEGSTKLSQQYPEQMPALLVRHHAILNQAITAHNGFTFEIVGDSFAVAFHNASDALEAALDVQRVLHAEAWSPAPIKVRMGIHTGPAQLQNTSGAERYSGYTTLATAQRIMSAGHGGQILLSQIVVDLIRDKLSAVVRLVDMRERHLKDIAQPVHMYQLTVPDLPSDFASLRTAEEVVNHNLPSQLTAFIGRETELASLKNLLSSAQNRLVTLVAPGGMGKTRLSLEAAAQMVQTFPQGIYFVALDRISSADQIVQAVADVLPISLASNEDPKSRIVEYLRDKKILLVMDNFEHVLEGATFVQDILRAAPQVQVLASSRAKLNLSGETIFNIEGLTVGESHLEKNSALQLFAQGARRTQPKFELNEATLPAVTRICRMVDGMPLAILLAAAWIDTLSVDEIGFEIENSLDMLETEKRDVPDRQRSVRAVIESSWNQVDVTAQNLLKRLSVFRGGFTRSAAQETAGASLRGLSQLVDKALLRRDPDTGRYSIHELLRQYAEEQLKLSADEERAAHENHAKYFADFMRVRGAHVRDQQQKTALMDIEADIDNIRIAWIYWADQQGALHLMEFVGALWIFFEIRGSFTPAIQFFEDAAKKLVTDDPEVVCARAELRARQAWFTALIGLPDEGLRMAQDSLNTLRKHHQDISVNTLDSVNINAIFLNKNDLVIQISQEMMARADRSGDLWERGWALIWSAYAFVLHHQIREALQAGQEALAMFEKFENPFGISVASGLILGIISMAMGDMRAAKEHFLRGMHAAEGIKYLRLLQVVYDNLGTLALIENDVEQAREFFLKSLRISQESGQTREMLASLRDLANVYIAQGYPDTALQLLAVVLQHPASEQNSLNRPERLRDEAEKLRAQIETGLDQSRYGSAWESGQRKRLADVVAQILN